MAMVKLFKLRSAEFSAKTELVLPDGVGEHVRKVSGDVFAACRGRQANRFKPRNIDLRRTRQVVTVVEVQAIACKIEVGIEVTEDLTKIVHTRQQLVR